MRARSIKPGICDNELLGTADPLYTLLFERLWMMADREGRLEDRPLRIKAQSFPYREGLDVEPMLAWLHQNQFILRYSSGEQRFIQVLKFSEHQSPHVKEAPSKIPAPEKHQTSPVQTPDKEQPKPALAALTPSSLTPDSGLLTADSGSLRSQRTQARASPPGAEQVFEHWRKTWNHPRGILDPKRRKRIEARLKDFTPEQLCDAISGFRNSPWHCGTDPKGEGTVYDGIETLLRDTAQVETGLRLLAHPPRPPPKAENATERILRHLNGTENSRVIEHEPDEQAFLPSY